jgi:indolepyruvate ferredoxin oxidoreductase
VVSSSAKASGTYRKGTRAAVNTAEMPTGDVVRFRDADLASSSRVSAIEQVIGAGNLRTVEANALAELLLGDSVYANMLMLGFAWQDGLVPVSLRALLRAIELNGVSIDRNKQALAWGRIARADPASLPAAARPVQQQLESLDQVIARHTGFLTSYQNTAYAARYEAMVARVRSAEKPLRSEALTDAVARSLFKLMAYKDEYEVARLHMETGFLDELRREFEGEFRVRYHLAPPLWPGRRDARGRPRKRAFGQWMQIPFRVLSHLKALRGTPFDLFGYSAERRAERELIVWYENQIEAMLRQLEISNLPELVRIARAPLDIRGYGPVKEAAIPAVKADVARRFEAMNSRAKREGGQVAAAVERAATA